MNTQTKRYADFFKVLGDARSNPYIWSVIELIDNEGSNEKVVSLVSQGRLQGYASTVDHVARTVHAVLGFYTDRRWDLIQVFIDRFNLEAEEGWNQESKKNKVSPYCSLGFPLGLLRWANSCDLSSEDHEKVVAVITQLILARNSSIDFFAERHSINGGGICEEGIRMNKVCRSQLTEELTRFSEKRFYLIWAEKVLGSVCQAKEQKLYPIGGYMLQVICYILLRKKYPPLSMAKLLVGDDFGDSLAQ